MNLIKAGTRTAVFSIFLSFVLFGNFIVQPLAIEKNYQNSLHKKVTSRTYDNRPYISSVRVYPARYDGVNYHYTGKVYTVFDNSAGQWCNGTLSEECQKYFKEHDCNYLVAVPNFWYGDNYRYKLYVNDEFKTEGPVSEIWANRTIYVPCVKGQNYCDWKLVFVRFSNEPKIPIWSVMKLGFTF